MLERVQRLLDKAGSSARSRRSSTRARSATRRCSSPRRSTPRTRTAPRSSSTSHPGVTHNYLRNHDFNLWFTIAVEPGSKLGLQGTLDVMAAKTGAQSIRQLPTLKLFKIRMDLEMEAGHRRARRGRRGRRAARARPDRALRRGHRDDPRHAGPDAGRLRALRAGRRAARRRRRTRCSRASSRCRSAAACAASPRSSTTAAPASPPTAWACGRCPRTRSSRSASAMAAFRGISHCYQRPTYADWPYSVFTMAHGRSKEECDAVLDAIAADDRHRGAARRCTPRRSSRRSGCSTSPTTSALGGRARPALTRGERSLLADRHALGRALPPRAARAARRRELARARDARDRARPDLHRARLDGAELFDVDGNIYVDYVCSWGPLIHGHAHPAVLEAVDRGRRARDDLRRADRGRGRARRARRPARCRRCRHAAHDLVGHRGVDERDPARARGHRPREAAQVRRRLPRPRRRAARRRRAPAWRRRASPPRRACPAAATAADRGRAVERPEAAMRAAFAEHEFAAVLAEPYPANMGLVPPALRVPRAAARARDRARRAARLRRGDHRLPGRPGRRAGADRRAARPHRDGQGHRRRAARRRLRRPGRR